MTKGQRQLQALNMQLSALCPDNAFQTPRLRAAGLDRGAESLEHFRSLPFTGKDELIADQAAHPPYGTNLTYPLKHYTRFHRTSGTSGRPLHWLDTPESWRWNLENWAQVFTNAGVRNGSVALFTFSFGPFLGFWSAFEAAASLGLRCLPAGGLSTRVRLEMIREHAVEVLCCTPTYALHLAETARAEGLDLAESALGTIIVGGEPGGSLPALRARLARALPAVNLIDHHGMTEIGPVSYQRPDEPGRLRLFEERFIAEVVEPESGRPVAPGEEGELVLTNLGRTACPLLRYRTGDLVRPVLDGEGGWDEADIVLEGGILGRIDDMVVVRGVNLYPSAVDEVVRRLPAIREYQVAVDHSQTLAQVEIRIESDTPTETIASLETALRDAFALRIPVRAVEPGSLPRFEMKARRWLRQ